MNKQRPLLTVFLFALLLTALFHKKAFGLNLLIAELLLMYWIVRSKVIQYKNTNHLTVFLGFLVTALATVFIHSVFSYVINLLMFLVLIGVVNYPEVKSLLHAAGHGISTFFSVQSQFLRMLFRTKLKGQKLGSYIWKFRIFIIPVVIILIFVFIYRKSNPVFDGLLMGIGDFMNEKLNLIFDGFDYLIFFTFLISLYISVFIFIRTQHSNLVDFDSKSSELLIRKRKRVSRNFRINALKNEYKSGIFLLLILNVLILFLNVIDIKWVWFNFEWEGQYLKQFVHEGTYLLILSILISIAVVLFYFRGNLNFYKENNWLKFLSYGWLFQNGILTLSVALRNFWYISYFALAYKRIGVIIFLALTVYGLFTVFVKVKQRKSAFYLFKTNTHALLIILVVSACFNWDTLIARYNFNHASTSFLHLDYLCTLSDKALPYLDKSMEELRAIDKVQKEKFEFETTFMSPETYHATIAERKETFKEKWQSKAFLSWNLPEYRAYQKLLSESASSK